MKKIITSLCVFTAVISVSNAQQTREAMVSSFAKQTNAKVSVSENSGIPNFIKFSPSSALRIQGGTPAQKAYNFLEANKGLFQLDQVNEELRIQKQGIDNYGLKNVSLQQEYKGVPVFDGVLRFHYDASENLTAVNGNIIPAKGLSVVPNIEKTEAQIIAIRAVENQNINYSGESVYDYNTKLYVFQKGLVQGNPSAVHLVYEVEVRNDNDVREFVYVDAHKGIIIEQFTGMAHALNRELYEKTLEASTKKWSEGQSMSGLNQWQKNEINTSEQVYYFFKNTFGRDSYDDKGATMKTVNNADEINCPNANWNGTRAGYCDGTAADDVVAHEWGHAYTQYTSGLIYAFQSGAMNESYSDVWGETIDLLNKYQDSGEDLSKRTGCRSSERWMIGEDASALGGAIRDMWKPSCKNDPDSMDSYKCYGQDQDAGGVHTNSGIPNHIYALLVDGGSYGGQTIKSIGFTKAAHIFWRAQSEYLTSTSDFTVLAKALEASAQDLIGKNLEGLTTTKTPAGPSGEKITENDVEQLRKAMKAVKLTMPLKDKCPKFTVLLKPTPDLCSNAKNSPIFKEDWENGIGKWSLKQLPTKAETWEARDWAIVSDLPGDRAGKAIFGVDPLNGDCKEDLQNGIIRLESPEIEIKSYEGGEYEMAFSHYITMESSYDKDKGKILFWDGGNIKYSKNGGQWKEIPTSAFSYNPYNATLAEGDNPMQNQKVFSGADGGSNSGTWGKSIFSLSDLGVNANDKVKFRFEVGTDGCNGRQGWFIDDIVIYNCKGTLSAEKFNTLNTKVSVYPNPSSGVYMLKNDSKVDLNEAKIFDINGRLLKTVELSANTSKINISDFSNGIYFMTVTSNSEKGTFKLIKK